MDELSFDFDQEKAIEVILYLANRLEDPGFHKLTHMLYYADKLSLERYGRFICGDDYFALPYGPVPSHTYNILKLSRLTDAFGFHSDDHWVIPDRDADIKELSESDIECLQEALELMGPMSFSEVKEASEDDAYEKAWEARGIADRSPMSLESIAEQLENSAELLSFLKTRHST